MREPPAGPRVKPARSTIRRAGTKRQPEVAVSPQTIRLDLLPLIGERLGEPFTIGAANRRNPVSRGEMRGLHDGAAVGVGDFGGNYHWHCSGLAYGVISTIACVDVKR